MASPSNYERPVKGNISLEIGPALNDNIESNQSNNGIGGVSMLKMLKSSFSGSTHGTQNMAPVPKDLEKKGNYGCNLFSIKQAILAPFKRYDIKRDIPKDYQWFVHSLTRYLQFYFAALVLNLMTYGIVVSASKVASRGGLVSSAILLFIAVCAAWFGWYKPCYQSFKNTNIPLKKYASAALFLQIPLALFFLFGGRASGAAGLVLFVDLARINHAWMCLLVSVNMLVWMSVLVCSGYFWIKCPTVWKHLRVQEYIKGVAPQEEAELAC